jgi:hypothetical protein
MLIEIWERLRGYDKWIQTEARIDSAGAARKALGKRYRVSNSSRFSANLLVWRDQRGKTHYGAFVNHDTSPLYQLLEDETITIRYDPARPDRYYCRSLWLSWTAFIAKTGLGLAVSLVFFVWVIWTILKGRAF